MRLREPNNVISDYSGGNNKDQSKWWQQYSQSCSRYQKFIILVTVPIPNLQIGSYAGQKQLALVASRNMGFIELGEIQYIYEDGSKHARIGLAAVCPK